MRHTVGYNCMPHFSSNGPHEKRQSVIASYITEGSPMMIALTISRLTGKLDFAISSLKYNNGTGT